MSQESANQLRNSVCELRDHRLDDLVNNVDNGDSSKSTSTFVSPALNYTNIDYMDEKLNINNISLNTNTNNQSTAHTPLLSTDTINDDNESLPNLEPLDTTNIEHIDESLNNLLNKESDVNPDVKQDKPIENGNNIGENSDQQESSNSDAYASATSDTLSNSIPEIKVLTQFELLRLRRQQFLSIHVKQFTGLRYYYIDKSWLSTFLNGEFDQNDSELFDKIGPIKTIHSDYNEKLDENNFIVFDQFKLLYDWFQLEPNNQIIERELVYSPQQRDFIIDPDPLTITPHIFCNSASQVNRFNNYQNRNHQFVLSSHRTVQSLFHYMLEYFDLQNLSLSEIRIWNIEFESSHSPQVIIPTTLKLIKKKSLISKKKKKNTLLCQRHISSGHLMLEVKQKDGLFFLDIESHILPGSGLVGLNNLGNTCYMNSALQCLVHIPELNSYFLYHYFEKELNRDNPLGNNGRVAMSFGALISTLFDNRHSGTHSSIAPKEFKSTIGHFNSLFADYRQQDSQEFIAYLLDGLHEDLNRVLKKPYVEKPELESGKEENAAAIKELAAKCWEAHKLRNNSVIVDLFVALYKSTLVCPRCGNISITFDPYNDLTLPLPITKKWTHKIKILPDVGIPRILEVQLNKNDTYMDLKKFVSKYMNVPMDDWIGVELFKNAIYKNFEDPSSDSRYLPISELISSGEDIWFYEVKNTNKNTILPVFSTVVSGNTRNNYGLPFFISLSDEERSSYGTIEKKMIQKYKQLSSSKLFEKLDEMEYNKFKPKDFEGIDLFFKYVGIEDSKNNAKNVTTTIGSDETNSVNNDNDEDDAKSVISFASPNFNLHAFFTTKVIDPSMDKSYYGRNHYNRFSNSNNSSGSESSIWFPENANSILKPDLPLLFDGLSLPKKCYYYYDPDQYQSLQDHYKAIEQESINAEIDDQVEKELKQLDEEEIMSINENKDKINDEMVDSEDLDADKTINMENGKLTGTANYLSVNNIASTNNSNVSLKTDISETDGYVTAAESLEIQPISENTRYHGKESNTNKSISPNISSRLSSAKSVSSSPSSASSSPSSVGCSASPSVPLVETDANEKTPLVDSKMAIVNEFNEEYFELCFCDTSDDEFNGAATWYNPQVLINAELEKERQANIEKAKKPVTLYDCLELFSKPETLGQNDLWYCPKCKEHTQATKKIEIWSAPDILTIHLKRFESVQSFSDKIDITVDFPIEGLDLTKYVANEHGTHIYDLFAVDNHYGGLGGGHYTAYVKNFVDGKWYYFNDSRVSYVDDPRESIKGSAYLLFYRRRSSTPLGGDYFQNIMIEIQKKNEELRKKLEEYQAAEQLSNTSISETSDEEMPMSAQSHSPSILEGATDEPNNVSVEIIDDGNKRRKLDTETSMPVTTLESAVTATEPIIMIDDENAATNSNLEML